MLAQTSLTSASCLLCVLQKKGQLADKKLRDFLHLAPVLSQPAADLPASTSPQQQHLQPQSPLIKDITEVGTPSHDDTALHDGRQQQATGEAHAQPDPQHREEKRSEQDHMRQFDERLQALEASSRRTERKVDQILQYCRTLAQAMNPT